VYSAFGLLKPDSDFSIAEASRSFPPSFRRSQWRSRPTAIVVSSAEWEIHLTLNDTPTVLEESRAMAERIGGAEDAKDSPFVPAESSSPATYPIRRWPFQRLSAGDRGAPYLQGPDRR